MRYGKWNVDVKPRNIQRRYQKRRRSSKNTSEQRNPFFSCSKFWRRRNISKISFFKHKPFCSEEYAFCITVAISIFVKCRWREMEYRGNGRKAWHSADESLTAKMKHKKIVGKREISAKEQEQQTVVRMRILFCPSHIMSVMFLLPTTF